MKTIVAKKATTKIKIIKIKKKKKEKKTRKKKKKKIVKKTNPKIKIIKN